jgi:hypothetical protein
VSFKISNPADAPFEAIACLPVGAQATVAGQAAAPPWAV